MRILKVTGLPPKRETGQVREVLTILGKELREYRHAALAKV